MKPGFNLKDIIIVLITATPVFFLMAVYPELKEEVPVHFNLEGQPDGFDNKSALWVTTLILMGAAVLVYLLLKFIPLIDPKKKATQSAALFQKIAMATAVLLTGISFLIIQSARIGSFYSSNLLFAGVGLMFAFIGNLMYSIKPNYFAGIRTPWTLEDEDTWRKTHQLASRLWVVGGLLIAVISFLLPVEMVIILFFSGLTVMVVIPVIFSYTYYKKHQIEKRSQ